MYIKHGGYYLKFFCERKHKYFITPYQKDSTSNDSVEINSQSFTQSDRKATRKTYAFPILKDLKLRKA